MTFRPNALTILALLLGSLAAPAVELRGRVQDMQQKPISGATVWIDQEQAARVATSAEDGQFQFDGVRVGPVDVVARKEGLALGGYSGFVIDNGDIVLTLAPPDELKLHIIDSSHHPVPGARIRSMRINSLFNVPVADLLDHGFPILRSNDDGLLVIPGIPQGGHLQFAVMHLDYADTSVPYLPPMKTRQDIILSPGIELRGRITATGKPVEKAAVILFVQSDKGNQSIAASQSDRDGFYRLRAPDGAYLVAARHPQYACGPPTPVLLKDDGKEHVADVTLLAPNIIRGTVAREDGRPLAGVRIAYHADNTIYEETLTQNDGSFQVKAGAKKGAIQVVPPPGFMSEKLATIPFDLGEAKEAVLSPIILLNLPEITGHVLNADASPASGVLVSSLNIAPPYWAITDETGAFTLRLGGLPDNELPQFRVEHPLRFQRAFFEVDARAVQSVEVTLKPFEPDLGDRPLNSMNNNLLPLLDKKAPEFKCDAWINSKPLSLADLSGKVIVLTFWGLFDDSPYALNRLLELRVLHDLLKGVDDVAIVTIHDASIEPHEVEEFVQRMELPFPIGCDADPFFSFMGYGINIIPQTVLIDKEGVLRYFQVEGRLLELVKALRRHEGK